MKKTAVLVGCGAMAQGWLKAIFETPQLRNRLKIVALVDLSEEVATQLSEQFELSDVLISTDLDQVLKQTKPDFVLDVVVPVARFEVVRCALKHGCHVISEKPMANNMTQAHQLVELAADACVSHSIIQNRRFITGIRKIQQYLTSGVLGEISAIHCDFFLGPHFGGFREEMEHVLLHDMAIHTFDAARFISGKQPLAVYCQETNPAGSWFKHGASANAIFEFSDNCTFTYRGSWCAQGANTSWESNWRIMGSKGTLIWDGFDQLEAHLINDDQGFIHSSITVNVSGDVVEDETLGHASVLINILNALAQGDSPETQSLDNIHSLEMVFAAIKSAETGQRVLINEESQ
ncbi:MAG: Gfo/Idh/MocA family oxidoreductase [Oceanospirillaceae bacterium]|nr:Gfo/Idh/MocA family oxidoreductase [Oceanospirillaceae bacterium]